METEEAVWVTLPDFEEYAISNLGDVMNIKTQKLLKPQLTPWGVSYVPLYQNGEKVTRSVKVLVAKAFVEGETDIFDTPINKDGDKKNNRVENIVWRPRWFAVKYSRQFLSEYKNGNKGPVFDTDTGERFENIYVTAITFGLLFRGVFTSCYLHTPVFPTSQLFHIPDTNTIHVHQ